MATDYDALRAQTVASGQDEEAVTVNTRALIDKVLARYSGEWTTLRELLQNAADASASKVTIKFETLPSSRVPLPKDPQPLAILKHTLRHQMLKRMIVSNNGQPFSHNDWARLKKIAEGNPDETKIGAFGVGFYSVFAECEEPLIRSGNEAMAFYWKGNSLFTRTSKLSEQNNKDTSFILDYRNNTTRVPGLLPLCQFLATSMTFVGISEIELLLDEWRLLQLKKTTAPDVTLQIPKFINPKTSEGLLQVTSATHEVSQLDATWLKVIGWDPKLSQGSSNAPVAPSKNGLQSFWTTITSSGKKSSAEKAAKAAREIEQELAKDLLGEGRATAFLHVTTGQIMTSVDKNFAAELERATKKPPPKTTRLALLTTSHNEAELSNSLATAVSKATDVLANVLPKNSGRIFIGFPTHQTTGLGAHISAPSVIPTVERESIDLNARWVRTWNEEMLRAAGVVSRIAWTQESNALKKQLDGVVKASESSKLLPEHIAKVLPQALHNLNQYEFSESTPSSKVGNYIEEGFWACDKSGSLQIDLLSTRGVLPSRDIRTGQDELGFLEGLPFLPKEIADKPPSLVKRLISVDVLTPVTITDIKRELERQSLTSKQLTEFLQWIAKKVKAKDIDAKGAQSLFKVTVANEDEPDERPIQLGLVRYFQNHQRIPIGLPVPPDTIPHKFTRNITNDALSALGWEDLQIVPWVRYLLSDQCPKDKVFDQDSEFASQVLAAISKQWKGCSDSSKSTLKSLLVNRTIIPTKLGMRKPEESYFKSVKLFDDIPTITTTNVSDNFLTTLGVRKTIELNLVFDRLLNPKQIESGARAWSHVDLIKYLSSVRSDIPPGDIKKLQQTAICTAEGDNITRYKASELYEPKDDLRSLNLKFVFWPGQYKFLSEEAIFMRILGLRMHPTVDELIQWAGNKSLPNQAEHALRYLVNKHHEYGSVGSEIAKSEVSFLPIEGDIKARSTPSTCFTNSPAAVFGCKILRTDLHPHAAALGVKPDPPLSTCIDWLLNNPPMTHRAARELFEYFASRMREIRAQDAETLGRSPIVPVFNSGDAGGKVEKRLPPNMCFLGRGGKYADILDYVDFDKDANTFLMRCGSKPEPTSKELAKLAINEPARILDTLNSTRRYLSLLTSIAGDWISIKQDKVLVRQMKESSFLLASRETHAAAFENPGNLDDPDDDEESYRSWQLAKASQVVVIDDPSDYNHFKAEILTAPMEEDLENMYIALGASRISSIVTQAERIGAKVSNPKAAERTKKLVVERIRLFFSEMSKDQIRRDGNWVEKNLTFVPVSGITIDKSLKGHRAKHSIKVNALYDRSKDGLLDLKEHIMYFIPGIQDFYHLSYNLCLACLNKPKPQQALVLTTLLENNLAVLQARGYNVSRILRRRQVEDRIQQEAKQKQLDEERARIGVAVTTTDAPGIAPDENSKGKPHVPGSFRESSELDDVAAELPGNIGPESTPLLTSFKDRMRDMWKGKEHPISSGSSGGGQVIDSNVAQGRRDHGPPQNVSSLQSKSEQILKASKAWRGNSLSSSGLEGMVNETPSFCDKMEAQNIVQQSQTTNGMKVFVTKSMHDPARFIATNGGGLDSFSTIILKIARAIGMPTQSLHLFQDEHSQSIAFNSGQALFFNYRFFEAWHLEEVQRGRLDSAIVYWYITMCHEAAHNVVDNHGPEFNFYMQNLIWHKFGAVAKLLRLDDDNNHTTRSTQLEAPPSYRP